MRYGAIRFSELNVAYERSVWNCDISTLNYVLYHIRRIKKKTKNCLFKSIFVFEKTTDRWHLESSRAKLLPQPGQFAQCPETRKNSGGFNGIRSHDLCDAGAMLNQLHELWSHTVGRRSNIHFFHSWDNCICISNLDVHLFVCHLFVWVGWRFDSYSADVDLLYPPTHILTEDSHYTGNFLPYSSRIVCGFFNVPQGTNEHGRYLRDRAYGL